MVIRNTLIVIVSAIAFLAVVIILGALVILFSFVLAFAIILDILAFARVIKKSQSEVYFFFDMIVKRKDETFSWAAFDFFLPFIARKVDSLPGQM